MADVIEERYGTNGVAFIIDEGFSGIEDVYGTRLAALGMAEKGSVSVVIKVDTPGGHSSVPPKHTGSEYQNA
jgi:Gly-Xaa carboxypeptidase